MKPLVLLIALSGCLDHPPDDTGPTVDAGHRDSGIIITTSDFYVGVTPTTVTLATPGSTVLEVQGHWTGPNGPLKLSVSHLPANVTATLSADTLLQATPTAQLTLTASAPTSGILDVDANGLVQHGEAIGTVTKTVNVTVTGT